LSFADVLKLAADLLGDDLRLESQAKMTDFKRKSAERELKENSDNAPPNSRLFIVCGKEITEDDFRDAFEAHGTVEKVEIHRDKKGESKGIAYIKFSKTSEAALAIEQLNGRCIGDHPRPLKVLIANNRDQANCRNEKEDERLLRLFVVVAKDQLEADLKEYFNTFGAVQYVNIVKDRETRLSKGFAYIKYYRLVHAAKAFETCDRSYKPVFADPRPPKCDDLHLTNGFSSRSNSDSSRQEGCCVLTVVCSPAVNEDQLWRLFDLIPGLDYTELRRVDPRNNRSVGTAVYTSFRAASYAKKKLHGFEYPPGERLIVKFDNSDQNLQHHYTPPPSYHHPPPHSYPQDLKSLADTIAQATSLIKAANLNDNSNCHYNYDPSYCSIALPAPQPLAPMDSVVAERLFVVCTPSPPPIYAVKDVFGRFGSLIDFYFLNGKRCGYALFSQAESANEAISSLNGQEICGARMKVMLAEPSKGNHSE